MLDKIRREVEIGNYWTNHYFQEQSYDQAKQYAEEAYDLALKHLSLDDPLFLQSLNNMATIRYVMGEYLEAEPLFLRVLEITAATEGEDNESFVTYANNLGMLYRYLGNYAAAAEYYRRALTIRRRLLGENHRDYVQTVNNLATLYFLIGDNQGAEQLFQQVLSVRRESLHQAIELLPDSSPYYPSVVVSMADCLNNLGSVHVALGRYADAEPVLAEALELRLSVLDEVHPAVAQSQHNLGNLYRLAGMNEEAESLLQRALSTRRSELGDGHPATASTMSALAVLYFDTGRRREARAMLEEVLEIRRAALGEAHPEVAETLVHLAILDAMEHRGTAALDLIRQAAATEDRVTGQVFSIGSERQRMSYLASIRLTLSLYLSLLLQDRSGNAAIVRLGYDLVARRKGLAAEALAVQRDAIMGGRQPALAPEFRRLTALRARLARKMLDGPGNEGVEAHLDLITEWTADKDHLEAELARQIPEMNLRQKLRQADAQAIASALPAGSALVEFVRFDSFDLAAAPGQDGARWQAARYLVFVLRAGEPDSVQMVDLGEAERIDRMVAAFRQSISGEREGRDGRDAESDPAEAAAVSVRSAPAALRRAIASTSRALTLAGAAAARMDGTARGTALRRALFEPLVPFLSGRTRLFLAPDGDLTRLPFEVLPTADGRRVIDDYHVSYVGAGRDVLRFGMPRSRQPAEPLVAANPDFDLGARTAPHFAPGLPFGRLEGTVWEGEAVARLLQVPPLVDGLALEATLKARSSPHILHVATHGFFLPNETRDHREGRLTLEIGGLERLSGAENPLLRSGLALAGANAWLQEKPLPAEAEDGLLTAEDVSGLDLLDTELVVLSACETGLGEVQVGEGVFGLRRSFVLAGARTLVMSLWKVPDQQTQELMEDFYRRVLDGQARAEALREAQLAMKAAHPDPRDWGAFICQGDPGPLARAGAAS